MKMIPMLPIDRLAGTAAVLSLLAAAALPVHAQGQARATIEKPSFDNLQSPDISVSKGKRFSPKDWLEIEAKVKVDVAPAPQSGFVDEMTVKWYVAVKNPEGGRNFLLLTKDVNHINVPVGEDIYVSVYLSPSTIKRLTGSERAGKSSVDRVGLEILRSGVKIGETSSKDKPGWWNAPSLSRNDRFPLLDKNQTPFNALWWDRYAEIQETR